MILPLLRQQNTRFRKPLQVSEMPVKIHLASSRLRPMNWSGAGGWKDLRWTRCRNSPGSLVASFDVEKNCVILKKLPKSGFLLWVLRESCGRAAWVVGAGYRVRRAEITTGWIASAPATSATLADYVGRNFETESAVPNTLPHGQGERHARSPSQVLVWK